MGSIRNLMFPIGTPDPRDVRPLRFPGAVAFIANGALLVLELVAGRLLAPRIGVSLYTWTAIIGVVLAGISLGSWLGGKLADRRPGRSVLSMLFLASAVSSALILPLTANLDSIAAPVDWATIIQVLWLTTVVFFIPSVLLGAVTPMIVKLALSSLDATGRVVGRIRGAAELGAIVGVFLTGYVLITAFGTRSIVLCVTLTLLLLAVATNPAWILLRREPAVAPAAAGGDGQPVAAAGTPAGAEQSSTQASASRGSSTLE
jgi:predicted MFS family arabinose efflux permease